MFLLASITKPVTYMAAMKLVERGLLNLADPVMRYVSQTFAAQHKEETLVQQTVHAHLRHARHAARQRRTAAAARPAAAIH